MRYLGAIVFVTVLIVGLYISSHQEEYRAKAVCEMFAEFKSRSFNGVIKKKFNDPDHHLNRAIILGSDKIHFNHDKSDFYEFISINDSITKKEGSAMVSIFREGHKIKEIEINYECLEEYKVKKQLINE